MHPTKNNEKLVRNTVHYFTDLGTSSTKFDFFKKNLKKVFKLLIIPNIGVTEKERDDYASDPEAYIRNDLEAISTDAVDNKTLCL